MKAKDVMTRRVMSIAPEATVLEGIRLMLQNRISGLPVIDAQNELVGIVTEGDFLRRVETATERKRPRWLEFIHGPGRLADEYVRAHGRKINQIMTRTPHVITEDTPLDEVVKMMEQHRIKRLPVVRGRKLVGIVSRANLMHALASVAREMKSSAGSDEAIRAGLLTELDKEIWTPVSQINVVVRNGTVELWGVITDERHREALKVLAENIPGVRGVRDHLAWMEPLSGTVIDPPKDQAKVIS